ncbi:hypothetical protein GS429_16870 [Natronorubrum sp. JWXQ-INN-674]|uniref:Uncharacterized protein n=1 Tax=Natronorubrum halalkaliphilum TaxID=2691917 RepID=A0A6B0VPF4_9EURY|nr:hypothetical protein [Natronorubrum halalkaliphilum]MXV63701.1 hypothetical protein [Natronorubrum halalkaliphilum]
MDVTLFVGSLLVVSGVIVYLFRDAIFWLLLFGMFDRSDLSELGHSLFKGAGLFLIFEGGLIVVLS